MAKKVSEKSKNQNNVIEDAEGVENLVYDEKSESVKTSADNRSADADNETKSDRECKKEKKLIEEKEAKIAELEAALSEEKDKYLRLCAEYDNFRKRAAKEKDALYLAATADSAEQLLPVLDNLERALSVENESDRQSGMYKGVEMIYSQCLEIFGKMGITEIEAEGKEFDPNFHNAVMHDEDPEVGENIVTAVFSKGYKIGDRVIRHSVVKVTN